MANSTENPPKQTAKRGTKLVQMESQTTPESVSTTPESDDSPPLAARPATERGKTNPKPFPIPPKASLKGGYVEESVGMAYWRGIPNEFKDRLTAYINREHPVLNRMVECTADDIELMRQHKKRYPIKYIDLPAEPFSEDTAGEFLNRYGSGKYKVFINDAGVKGAKEADLQSRNLCKFMVRVYDSDFPPILDPSRPDKGLGVLDWTHPDNQSYVAELRTRGIFPPNEKAGDDVAESVVTTLVDKISDLSDRVGVHETDRLVERIAEKVNGGQTRASETLDTIRAVKEMMAPAAGQAAATAAADKPADPFDTAAKIMAMRANDPMTAVMMTLLTNANTATEAAREREFKLQQQLLEAKSAPANSKSLADQALELLPLFDKFEPLLKRMGFGNGATAVADAAVRVARTTGMDILHDVVTNPQIVQTIYAAAVNLPLLFGRGAPAPQNGQATSAAVLPAIQPAPAAPTAETDDQRLERIGSQVTEPMLYQFFLKGQTGGLWAEQMRELWPNEFKFTQALGAERIVNAYRLTRAWMIIGPMEADFLQFMTEFCQWTPEDDEGPVPPGNGDDGVVDLEPDAEGAKA